MNTSTFSSVPPSAVDGQILAYVDRVGRNELSWHDKPLIAIKNEADQIYRVVVTKDESEADAAAEFLAVLGCRRLPTNAHCHSIFRVPREA
ncbi:hypothetical protein [Burkholderia pyrrocinia]|uniref:hypothetical protein n=1 Tax=Burkholderia pyrrocinia TaxID=60550 RepID=UPI001BD0D30B|nr:hypothetical protein [Burkholderia pyrrocinia]QVN18947.1 hypothetical protein JYG32_04200 [Burkholderia pyrrocinia]